MELVLFFPFFSRLSFLFVHILPLPLPQNDPPAGGWLPVQ